LDKVQRYYIACLSRYCSSYLWILSLHGLCSLHCHYCYTGSHVVLPQLSASSLLFPLLERLLTF